MLTAGLGTRLRPADPGARQARDSGCRRAARPAHRAWLAAHGVTDVVLNLHHLPATITAVVGDGSDLAVRVRYSWEQPLVLGSAGGPRQALPILGADTFLIVNGDTLTDVDLSALALIHSSAGALVTLAFVPNREPDRYGGVLLDRDQRDSGSRPGDRYGSFHFVGVQMVERDVFASLPAGQPAQSVGGVYDALIADATGSVRGFVTEAAFLDIGTVTDYWSASWSLDRSRRCQNGCNRLADTHRPERERNRDPSSGTISKWRRTA